jgi:cation transport regulator ChaB
MATNNITDALKKEAKDILSEEALNEIETAFNAAVEDRASLAVGAALVEQDDDHAKKVQELLEAIDDDHTNKLQRIVEAVNVNHSQKLVQVVEKFGGQLQNEATEFKGSLVDNVSNYLELYLEKTFPQDMLEEAVNNKRADQLLGELRKMLAVDMALAKDSIKGAVVDGKKQINEANQHLADIIHENDALKADLEAHRAHGVLQHLSQDLPEVKKNYVKNVLAGRDAEFIAENFDYTVQLFNKQADQRDEQLRDQAVMDVQGNVQSNVEDVIVESSDTGNHDTDPFFNEYMGELGKY